MYILHHQYCILPLCGGVLETVNQKGCMIVIVWWCAWLSLCDGVHDWGVHDCHHVMVCMIAIVCLCAGDCEPEVVSLQADTQPKGLLSDFAHQTSSGGLVTTMHYPK